jgi:MFS family permease
MTNQRQHSQIKKHYKTNKTPQGKNYKYFILALGCLSAMILMAIPNTSLSILMPDISDELNLTIVQVGVIWGIGALPSLASGLFAGPLGDKYGFKPIAILVCFLTGLSRIFQGLAPDFFSLTLSVILIGLIGPFLLNNVIKLVALWFSAKELGIANSILAMGMAVGFLVGSSLSGTVFLPWLGSWRNVFIFFGVLSFLLIIPWFFSKSKPISEVDSDMEETTESQPFFAGLRHVVKIPNIWFLSLSILFIGGSSYALLGYLPLYLEGLGWQSNTADFAVTSVYLASMISVLPLSHWSNKTGKLKTFLIVLTLISSISFGVLSFAKGNLIWFGLILIGLTRDAFMSISTTLMLKFKGLDHKYLGSASSFRFFMTCIGLLFAPMIGNKLAESTAYAPIIFWTAFSFAGILFLSFLSSGKTEPDSN